MDVNAKSLPTQQTTVKFMNVTYVSGKIHLVPRIPGFHVLTVQKLFAKKALLRLPRPHLQNTNGGLLFFGLSELLSYFSY